MADTQTARHDGMNRRETALLALVTVAALSTPFVAGSAATAGVEPRVFIFAPWTSAERAATASLAAGLRVLRPGAYPFVIVAASDADAATPAGLWLVLDLGGLGACLDGERGRSA